MRTVSNDEAVRALLARDAEAFLRQAGSTPCRSAIRRAKGAWLEDASGRRILDFHGNSVHHIGYAHPRLVETLKSQLEELPFTPRRFTDEPAVALAERLAAAWPGRPGKVLLATGGSDAIEIALKIARVATGRYKTLSFYESYHGSGFGALSVGGRPSDRVPRLGPLLPGARHVAPFYPTDAATSREAAAQRALEAIRQVFRGEPDIAALIAEPIRSTPHLPPDWFWPQVRALCDEHGTRLIFDEIPTGLGKTGALFAAEHVGAVPDMTVLGKALGGAVVPIAAVIARAELDVAPELALGHYTHEKNPFTARAALTTLDIIETEGLVERAQRLGARTLELLQELAAKFGWVRGARGIGLLLGLELEPGAARKPSLVDAVIEAAFARGLNLARGDDRTITLTPPLTVSEDELRTALEILEDALGAVPPAAP